MNTDPITMTAGQINKELDKLDVLDSANTTAMIAAGLGNEKYTQSVYSENPLSRQRVALAERRAALRYEITQRYGPEAPSRLPKGKGFGARAKDEGYHSSASDLSFGGY